MVWVIVALFAPLIGMLAVYGLLVLGARACGLLIVWALGDISTWWHKGVKL